MSELSLPFVNPDTASPFDAIRQVRADGTEFWSARDLMPLLGYDKWQNFEAAITRAKTAITNQNMPATSHVTDAGKLVERPQGGTTRLGDFYLSRFACYLVAMNGDPRKQEVAAAQAYFAIQTRVAETKPALTEDEIVHQALQITARKVEALTAKVAILEPKAEFYDELMESDGTYAMNAAAHILGWGRNVMMSRLRKLGILQGNNLPYRRYDHHFKVTPSTYVNRKTGETVPTATTYVRPSGLDFLRKKLAGIHDPMQLELETAN